MLSRFLLFTPINKIDRKNIYLTENSCLLFYYAEALILDQESISQTYLGADFTLVVPKSVRVS
jgi:hypothetical protein